MKIYTWDERIARAEKLSKEQPAVRQLLDVYLKAARLQKQIGQSFTQTEHTDIRSVLKFLPELKALVQKLDSPALSRAFEELGSDQERWSELLLEQWEQREEPGTPARAFLAWVLIQPYAQHMMARMAAQTDTELAQCPACGNPPQVSMLREFNNGAKRSLVCVMCATEWEVRRVLCVNCGEEHKDKLPVFSAEEFAQARIEACDNCKTYIKCLDLTKDGHAVPQVDDLATLALDLWAHEQGYERQQPNIFMLPAE
ncbi:MAG TPA: formate dehydrogenase accessory protein FdhE [Candidatus Saccharimonadales bacterium]|jgi:FdhE protein|nr:formate dehydrogenase accessory protein FdhE [Candidatus Saccharimonadales bacterium]